MAASALGAVASTVSIYLMAEAQNLVVTGNTAIVLGCCLNIWQLLVLIILSFLCRKDSFMISH